MFSRLLIAFCFLAFTASSSFAGFVLSVTQVGSNLTFSYAGSMEISSSAGNYDFDSIGMRARKDAFQVTAFDDTIGPSGGSYRFVEGSYLGLNGAGNFFPNLTTAFDALQSSNGNGDTILLDDEWGYFGTKYLGWQGGGPGTYSASGSFTVANKTLADLGLAANDTRVWEWTQLNKAFVAGNTFTITAAVPEPSSLTFVGGLFAGLGLLVRRRKK